MENAWLAKAKRLHAIASTGLHFTQNPFDRERFEDMLNIANAMLADLGNVPVEQIVDLLPAPGQCYATPMVEVRGAVIVDQRILLVQEKFDGLWTLPGGYADVGLSPAENVVKEVAEEAGLTVRAEALYSLRHKAKGPYRQDSRDFYKCYFLCSAEPGAQPCIGPETTDVGFFSREALPPLSRGRTIPRDIDDAFAFASDPRATRFD